MRNSVGPIIVALLCVVALGLAAATLTSVANPDAESGQGAPEKGASEQLESQEENGTGGISILDIAPDTGCNIAAALAPILCLLSIAYALDVYDEYRSISRAGITFLSVFVPLMLIAFLLSAAGGCGPTDIRGEFIQESDNQPRQEANPSYGNASADNETVGEGGSSDTSSNVVPDLSSQVVLLGVIVVLLVALLARRSQRSDSLLSDESASDSGVTESIGEVAGETADRIEGDAALENEVYEAWAEMASILDVDDPETSSPEEFADAAREAGIERRDVEELTRLFEEVRYGTADPTPMREQRSVEALRRIERTYTDSEEGADR